MRPNRKRNLIILFIFLEISTGLEDLLCTVRPRRPTLYLLNWYLICQSNFLQPDIKLVAKCMKPS